MDENLGNYGENGIQKEQKGGETERDREIGQRSLGTNEVVTVNWASQHRQFGHHRSSN